MRGRLLSAALGALAATLALVPLGASAPADMYRTLFGPALVRAEVVTRNATGLHDYRLDRGRIRAIGGGSITLYERDGSTVVVPLAPNARVDFARRIAGVRALRRGMLVLALREGESPAHWVIVQRR